MEKKPQPDAIPDDPTPAPPRSSRRRRRRVGLATVISVTIASLVFFVLSLALTGRTLTIPEMLRTNLENRLNAHIEGAPLRLGSMEFGIDRRGVPQLLMRNIRFADNAGGGAAQLNWLGAELSLERLIKRKFPAERIFLTGAQITIRRTADGQFTLTGGPSLGDEAQSISDLLGRIDREMHEGSIASLREVNAGGVVITLEDARSGRIWQATNAVATLRQTETGLSMSITSDVFNGTDSLATVQLSLSRSRTTEHVQLGVTVDNMDAADIALQSPVLAWLGVLDAPLSGSVRTELDETGRLARFAGTLDIAAGALQPVQAAPPVAFEAAKAYFTFDPDQQRIDFSEVSFTSKDGSGVATGHTYLAEITGAWPGAYLGQFSFQDVSYAGGDSFDGPLRLDDIHTDVRVRLDPFAIDLGQVTIDNQGVPIHASGRISADAEGWHVAVDATTPKIGAARVLQFWPRRVSPVTRGWVSRNLAEGMLRKPAFGVRFQSGQKPDLALSFSFDDGQVRFLPDMPTLTAASGRAVLHDNRFSLTLDSGDIAAGTGEDIDAAGSSFTVLDTRPKPSWGQIDVAARGRLDALLDVLDNRPLRLMERADRPVDLARADVAGRARIILPLKDGILADEVTYDVAATLNDVTSDQLVVNRVLSAPELLLTATPEAVAISGDIQLDGVPLTANWRQPLGAASVAGGEITGQVKLSSDTIAAFDLPLPEGFVSGEGSADYALQLPADPDIAPTLTLTSDLFGIGLGLEAVGWRKPPEERGALQLSAQLGDVPEIDVLSIETDDLSFDGALDLGENGVLQSARFQALELGNWLDADVELTPSPGGGPPTITVLGGAIDLRQLQLGTSGDGQGGGTSPINLRLDRLIVSDGIALAPLRGQLELGPRGLTGTFEARLNGQTPIQGVLASANAGTAVRLTSADAAGVLRDAGLTPNARRGTLDLVLTPVSGAPSGTFDGEFLIENILLRDAPAMADLLDAVSVVGLIDQLGGAGIRFDTVDGRFRMNRRQLRLQQAAAVGPSIGISADGLYDLQRRQLDFQGVVSPVYFLNGIGSFLTRRGEGLFGFNYRMAGSTADPSVRVNPLSILTPGAFRQIFRSAPPGG